ncbi:MAG: V-type ATP synthase subunit A, partial [Candidatus Hydrogenedentes bacterium]|nr:V-type ATP synthase subunit A [Candidatus Hydrogenedentota bacterium]
MSERIVGQVSRVVGPVVEAGDIADVAMIELVYVGEERLVGEVVRIRQDRAWVQVYEDTTGLRPGAPIYGSGEPLSVELGPGLLGGIYDGVQRPLDVLRKQTGDFVSKGVHAPALARERAWGFTPSLQAPCEIKGGAILGTVQETELIQHRILLPPDVTGKLTWIAPAGSYTVEATVARVQGEHGERECRLSQKWPVRVGRPYDTRLAGDKPLITGQRVLDTLFPVARG